MIENFIEYMWYLLTTPLKKLKKSLNKWYILCKVFGIRFDEVKEDILRARDEGMVVTCSQEMLQVHGADRRLSRYEGEHLENYRSRIAMYEEVCKLGGTNEGVILAVRTLGFENVQIKSAKELYSDFSRWAEFYIILPIKLDSVYPISLKMLKKEVRKTKEVGAKDNYLIRVQSEICIRATTSFSRVVLFFRFRWYDNVVWNGLPLWNGEHCWDSHQSNHPMCMIIKIKQRTEISHLAGLTQKYHFRTWDGMSCWNGDKKWDAEMKKEVL